MTSDLSPKTNWKSQVYAISGLTGVVVGLLAAYFYVRATEENGVSVPKRLKTMDMIGLAVTLLSIVRQITDLGAGGGKK